MRETATLDYADFCRTTTGAFVKHQVDTPDPDRFRGRVTARHVGEVGVAMMVSADHAVARTARDIDESSSDHYKVSVQLRGLARLSQDGVQTELQPGDFVIYDTAHPYRIGFVGGYRSVVMMLPKQALPVGPATLAPVIGQRLRRTAGPNGCFLALLTELATGVGEVDRHESSVLAGSVVDLLGLSLQHELGADRALGRDGAMRTAILTFIDDHLGDPHLGPVEIAEAHHISVSRLHALFRGTGVTVAAHIRSKRLSGCQRALTDPRQRDRTLTQIALDHGFTDSAHFSRLYRGRFGVSPRESRRRSL